MISWLKEIKELEGTIEMEQFSNIERCIITWEQDRIWKLIANPNPSMVLA